MTRSLLFAVLLAALVAGPARAQGNGVSPEEMEASTVRVVALIEDPAGRILQTSTGSGVVVADGVVVTNAHVAFDVAWLREAFDLPPQAVEAFGRGDFTIRYLIPLTSSDYASAEVVWRSNRLDLALLRPSRDLGRPAAALAGGESVGLMDEVYAVGYPGAAERLGEGGATLASILSALEFAPTHSNGRVNKRPTRDERGRLLIQTNADINRGNSGGPLFDRCGRVVGIVAEKSALDNVQGIGWAVHVEELLERNPSLPAAEGPCPVQTAAATVGRETAPADTAAEVAALDDGAPPDGSGGSRDWVLYGLLGLAVVLAGAGLVVASRRSSARTEVAEAPAPEPPAGRPVLRALAGPYRGQTVPLPPEPLAIGRDPRLCHLVLPDDTAGISKVHCHLSFDAEAGRFQLEDAHSSYGTFLGTGSRLEPGRPYPLRPGARFYLADPAVTFQVALDDGRP